MNFAGLASEQTGKPNSQRSGAGFLGVPFQVSLTTNAGSGVSERRLYKSGNSAGSRQTWRRLDGHSRTRACPDEAVTPDRMDAWGLSSRL